MNFSQKITESVEEYPFIRFLRILLSVCVCLVASMSIASLIWGGIEGHYTHRAAVPLVLLTILFPLSIGFVTAATAVLFAHDRQVFRNGPSTLLWSGAWIIVALAGFLLGYVSFLFGAFGIFIVLYWLMTGRISGQSGWSIVNFWSTRWDEKLYLIFMIVLLTPAVTGLASGLFYSILPVNPGVPAYHVQHENQMDSALKRALHNFPNTQSCLNEGADSAQRTDLVRMDWDQISNSSEAEVCIFRLLHGWGNVSDAESWLEAQGFRVGRRANSQKPFIAKNGTLSVSGVWSIRELARVFRPPVS